MIIKHAYVAEVRSGRHIEAIHPFGRRGEARKSVIMLGIHELWLFVLSGLMLNVVPGPDTAYIVGRSIQLGWRGGAAAAIGITRRCLLPVFGAAIGLSALLMASSAAFAAVKLVGAAYLLFTGLQMLLSRPQPAAEMTARGEATPLGPLFWQGALTNTL